ncbi:MAG: glucose-1-phosphate cytidylyltransferase [Candidatus Omnitrophota bacterium]
MKAVILAGGRGTRISEETLLKPKPLIEVGGMPILWHIMKIYSAFGIYEFVICCGYKSYMIKEFFSNYFLRMTDVTFDMKFNNLEVHQQHAEPWRVTVVDTGEDTMTGGRLKRAREYIGSETFCFTYGDGVSDLNIQKLLEFHRQQKTIATMTATQHYSRFGVVNVNGSSLVSKFIEKPRHEGSWLNSGFFVMEPRIFDYIEGDHVIFEKEPIAKLVADKQLAAYRHEGFFQGMDSLRDRELLEGLWREGKAPWKVWA